jgi:adenylate cyclase, class 2
MGYEVEVKYRLVEHDQLERRLAERGADREPEITHEDIYLSHPSRDFTASNEAFRIRRIGADNRITYKGPRRSGPTKTREEIEISVASGEVAFNQLLRLFENLGFRPVATVRKSRANFHLNQQGRAVVVALDRAPGLGIFAEIEALAETEAELPAAQAAVLALADDLGLTEVEPRSYLRMLLDRRDDPAGPLGRVANVPQAAELALAEKVNCKPASQAQPFVVRTSHSQGRDAATSS